MDRQVLHVRVVLARKRPVNLVAEQIDEGAVLGDVTSVTLVFPFRRLKSIFIVVEMKDMTLVKLGE